LVKSLLANHGANFPALLRKSEGARIVNVSSGLGSLTINSTPNPYRATFNPGFGASKTALNASTLAFAIDLEAEGAKVNAVTPGFPSTALNNYEGTETVRQGAAEAVRIALLGSDGPTGTFTGSINETCPWELNEGPPTSCRRAMPLLMPSFYLTV